MAIKDMQGFLAALDAAGQLKVIDQEVDWNLEAAAVGAMNNRVGQGKHALLFDNIKGYPRGFGIATSLFAGDRRSMWSRFALALGLDPQISYYDFREEYLRRLDNPIKPMEIAAGDAPCKEVVRFGKEADHLEFPIPYSHACDGGRYLTMLAMINRDPDTGWVNWGNYRYMIIGPRKASGSFNPTQHGPSIFFNKYEARNHAMPVCIAVMGDPAIFIAATYGAPAGVCEADIAGGLHGEPMEVVKAETNDLFVPARAEIVLEGEVRPHERADEGPFGEYSGFSLGRTLSPVFRINCITYRKNPVIPLVVEGVRTNDTQCFQSLQYGVSLYQFLTKKMKFPVRDVFMSPELGQLMIATDVPYPGYVQELASAVFATSYLFFFNWITIVDSRVHIHDPRDTLEELALNCHPGKAIHHTDLDPLNFFLTFNTPLQERIKGINGGKVAFDCTTGRLPMTHLPARATFESAYSAETQEKVAALWKRLGLDQEIETKPVFQ